MLDGRQNYNIRGAGCEGNHYTIDDKSSDIHDNLQVEVVTRIYTRRDKDYSTLLQLDLLERVHPVRAEARSP